MSRLPLPAAPSEYGVLAHAPEVLDGFRRLYGGLWQHGIVDHPTKEVVRLRNARLTGCAYCKSVRFAMAREDGLTESDVTRIDDGWATSALTPRWKAAIAVADVVLGRAETAEPTPLLAPAELVEVAVTAALCHGFSKIAVAFGGVLPDLPVTIVPTPAPPA